MSKRMLITAGPTREPIDAVRFIGNRSSGKLGVAIAEASQAAGHRTRLLLGPVGLAQEPQGVELERFETTAELQLLLRKHQAWFDVLIMAAAVADYRPAVTMDSDVKLERQGEGGKLVLELESTPDLVAEVCQSKRADQRVVAFALEQASQLEERATAKMQRKQVDAIVANPLATMDAAGIDATLMWADGRCERASEHSVEKAVFAKWLIERVLVGV